ncbi:sulfur carrier protein ThiS [Formicincola oecophyllae]|uniref:Sulfur carrier protein ThiS n=2 Tax=Formicincola oecophyllae TaxID=2558361 RepID=A0A4Y6UEF5_9PROT|nr:sulfur carrier protein ThiS [Formicincola oecophyllae]
MPQRAETAPEAGGGHFILNGERYALPLGKAPLSLAQVLEALSVEPYQVATAHNGQFIPQGARKARMVRAGDRVEVIAPMQGG